MAFGMGKMVEELNVKFELLLAKLNEILIELKKTNAKGGTT